MPVNHELTTNTPETNPEETAPSDEVVRAKNHELGAKILAQVGFENRHKEIVDSSFARARKKGEKLSGQNNERRNSSYLNRIERLISEHGNEAEQRLWRQSVDKLIIAPKDILDSYWTQQEQILRDDGQGRILTNQEKRLLTDDIREKQRESLESWSTYLGDENSPFPIWFKVYAWDGMSKMGVFDKDKQQFSKRDKNTVAPYPKLNPAVLAKVYNVITDLYNGEVQDKDMEKLAKSGSFNKLYSKILLSEKTIPKTPEKTEDVHGEWLEYLPGEEEKLAAAAEGTPWCVADPGTGRNYLETGGYNGGEQYRPENNQAKFILFHLRDPETGTLSESACASVRLGTDGKVAEISGLKEGQAIEDSLIPIVEEKVRSLPGGERFLDAFADKKRLIALDRKMKNGEDLTREELEFIYEVNRPIVTLDTYNNVDPRVLDLKQKYGIEYALNNGIDYEHLSLDFYDTIDNLGLLVKHGFDIDNFVSTLSPEEIIHYLDALMSNGAKIDVNELVDQAYPSEIAYCLDPLILRGAKIDINELVKQLTPYDIASNLDSLISHGAKIDVDKLAASLSDMEREFLFSGPLSRHGAKL